MLKLDFLNVGHGDCTIIQFPSGRIGVVDINNGKIDSDSKSEIYNELGITERDIFIQKMIDKNFDEEKFLKAKGYDIDLTDPVDWMQSQGIVSIFRFICTHPDMDHLSGLHKLNESTIGIQNFWDIEHSFDLSPDDGGFKSGKYDYKDWEAYQKYRACTVNPKRISPLRNSDEEYWNQDGIYILSPNNDLVKIAHETEEKNHLSYVLLIKYGKVKVYLCGDATSDQVIPAMLEHYGEQFFKKNAEEVVILKAPHHGRDSGFHDDFVKLLDPDAIIVSVGKKPTTDASNKYRKYCDKVWSTRWKGNISMACNQIGNATYTFQYDR